MLLKRKGTVIAFFAADKQEVWTDLQSARFARGNSGIEGRWGLGGRGRGSHGGDRFQAGADFPAASGTGRGNGSRGRGAAATPGPAARRAAAPYGATAQAKVD